MSSKIGTILSSLFIIFAFLFCSDLINLQFIYSDLDSKSVNISYLISRNANISEAFTRFIEKNYKLTFYSQTQGAVAFGDEIKYVISTDFKPLIMSSESMTVSIERMVIVGYYG